MRIQVLRKFCKPMGVLAPWEKDACKPVRLVLGLKLRVTQSTVAPVSALLETSANDMSEAKN